MADRSYALNVAVLNNSNPTTITITPASDSRVTYCEIEITPGTCMTTRAKFSAQRLILEIPGGMTTATATIVTGGASIDGTISMDSPVDVPLTVTLYDRDGGDIATYTLAAHHSSGTFHFALPPLTNTPNATQSVS